MALQIFNANFVKAHTIRVTLGLLGWAALASAGLAQTPGSTRPNRIELAPGFRPDPAIVDGISGGRQSGAQIVEERSTPTGPCVGYVDRQPNHTLVLRADFDYLSLTIDSQEDTVLLLQGPGGVWCNDDSVGQNPRIAGEWLAGEYFVWVGSYQRGQYNPYTLSISREPE
ncbi:MAG: hypothetical protein AAGF66_12170 [Cyanobacteria bacterium P01_H01_bin.119]